jgi:hypothetical protein
MEVAKYFQQLYSFCKLMQSTSSREKQKQKNNFLMDAASSFLWKATTEKYQITKINDGKKILTDLVRPQGFPLQWGTACLVF